MDKQFVIDNIIDCIYQEAKDELHTREEKLQRISGMKTVIIWLELLDTNLMDQAREVWADVLKGKYSDSELPE